MPLILAELFLFLHAVEQVALGVPNTRVFDFLLFLFYWLELRRMSQFIELLLVGRIVTQN